jgi:hypothetical protein
MPLGAWASLADSWLGSLRSQEEFSETLKSGLKVLGTCWNLKTPSNRGIIWMNELFIVGPHMSHSSQPTPGVQVKPTNQSLTRVACFHFWLKSPSLLMWTPFSPS